MHLCLEHHVGHSVDSGLAGKFCSEAELEISYFDDLGRSYLGISERKVKGGREKKSPNSQNI